MRTPTYPEYARLRAGLRDGEQIDALLLDLSESFDKVTPSSRGSSVVRHLPLVLEVRGSIPLAVRKISVSEHAFSSVICRDVTR